MTKDELIAFENLQRIAMDHVQIAGAIDNAIQVIKIDIDTKKIDYLKALIKMHQLYLTEFKVKLGNDLDARENEAWNDLLFAIQKEDES